jgi:hypothetical protein
MKKSTPVIMGIVLIVGLAALGYLDQFDVKSNNSSNNNSSSYPFPYSIPGEQQLTNYQNIQQPSASPTSSANVSSNSSGQNSSSNVQNVNATS